MIITVLSSAAFLLFYFANLLTPASSLIVTEIENLPPVSIIICANNEAENISKNLHHVLQQDFAAFEVIVVNDNSTDNTPELLSSLQKKFTNLKILNTTPVQKKLPGKKWLLYHAMQHAQHHLIALTDADCYPATNQWLKYMAAQMIDGTKVVLGYSPYEKGREKRDGGRRTRGERQKSETFSILTALQRFESTQTAWQYFSNAMKGKAYMGVGRNMLVRKNDYMNWFETTKHQTAGGDDDLFVNWLVNEGTKDEGQGAKDERHGDKTIAICLDEAAIVYTTPQKTYLSWLIQKTRHAKASYHYSWADKVKLFAFALSQFGFYATCLALLFFGKTFFALAIALLALWSVIQILISRSAYKALLQKDLLLWIPLLQPIYVFSISLIFLLTFIKRSDTWN